MTLFLRDYQKRAVEAVCRAARNGERRITVCQPVGTGKTEVQAALAQIGKYPLNIIPLVDLMWQNADRMELRLGEKCEIEQGMNYAESIDGLRRRVIVASRDSLLSNERYKARAYDRVSLVMVDECHYKLTPQMERMLLDFESRGATIVGFSATPYKGRGKGLRFFPRPQYVYTLREAINDAWLLSPKCFASESKAFDLTLVDEVAGEWDRKQLSDILSAEHCAQEVTSLVLSTYNQQPSVVYAHCVRQAKLLVEVFERYGKRVSIVYAKQAREVRKANMDAFMKGETNVIVNVGILGMGWDHPGLINIYSAAPTKSLSKLEQRIGRVLRPLTGTLHPEMSLDERRKAILESGKPHGNYYDITGNIRNQQLLSVFDILDAQLRKSPNRRERLASTLTMEGVDPLEAIREADAADHAELERQAQELLEKRKSLLIGVTFDHDSRDPFAKPEGKKPRGWRMMYGKYRGQPLSSIPEGYLSWVMQSTKKESPFKSAVRKELDRRAKESQPS